jgi:hypothetical protein
LFGRVEGVTGGRYHGDLQMTAGVQDVSDELHRMLAFFVRLLEEMIA